MIRGLGPLLGVLLTCALAGCTSTEDVEWEETLLTLRERGGYLVGEWTLEAPCPEWANPLVLDAERITFLPAHMFPKAPSNEATGHCVLVGPSGTRIVSYMLTGENPSALGIRLERDGVQLHAEFVAGPDQGQVTLRARPESDEGDLVLLANAGVPSSSMLDLGDLLPTPGELPKR
jgi:hypothetical protein